MRAPVLLVLALALSGCEATAGAPAPAEGDAGDAVGCQGVECANNGGPPGCTPENVPPAEGDKPVADPGCFYVPPPDSPTWLAPAPRGGRYDPGVDASAIHKY